MRLPTIANVLQEASQQLAASSETPLLDAEILLAETLKVSRSHLFAFPERELTSSEASAFAYCLEQRAQKIPLAYITGHREFWSLDLIVTRDTLIPRPETELLVELVLQEEVPHKRKVVADLGTGSGAIAIAIAHERPGWEVHATDLSAQALEVARLNALRLKVKNIVFHQGDWTEALPVMKFDIIVSNPPYIAADDPHFEKENLRYEPQSALMGGVNGLVEIDRIAQQAFRYLSTGGSLILEHGFQQAAAVSNILANLGYSDIKTYRDLAGLQRVTCGKWNL